MPGLDPEPAPQPTTKKRAPKPEAPPLVLDDTPETALECLRRRIAEDKLDPAKVSAWLDAQSLPMMDVIGEPEAEGVLAMYLSLREAAKS